MESDRFSSALVLHTKGVAIKNERMTSNETFSESINTKGECGNFLPCKFL